MSVAKEKRWRRNPYSIPRFSGRPPRQPTAGGHPSSSNRGEDMSSLQPDRPSTRSTADQTGDAHKSRAAEGHSMSTIDTQRTEALSKASFADSEDLEQFGYE